VTWPGSNPSDTLFDGTPLTIRPADTGDAAVVTLGLFRSVLEEGRYAVQTPFEVTVTGGEEQGFIESTRDNPDRLCLVAEGAKRWSERSGLRRNRTAAPVILRGSSPVGSRLLATPRCDGAPARDADRLGTGSPRDREAWPLRLLHERGRGPLVPEAWVLDRGRNPRTMQFEDDSYADTVAMGLLLVTPRPAQAPA
jgi:hypothetical protein